MSKTERKIYRESLWEWEDDDGSWRSYPKDISNQLDQCTLSQNPTPVEYNPSYNQRYEIYPLKDYQINVATNKIRKIRRTPIPILTTSAETWEFEGDDGWKQYDQSVCEEINNAIKQVTMKKNKMVQYF